MARRDDTFIDESSITAYLHRLIQFAHGAIPSTGPTSRQHAFIGGVLVRFVLVRVDRVRRRVRPPVQCTDPPFERNPVQVSDE